MKTLFLQRHAKSTWNNQQTDDFERSLNEQGERDLTIIGEMAAKCSIQPELIISSSAKRALQTAQAIATYLNYDLDNIIEHEILYTADFSGLITYIHALDQQYQTIDSLMLVGHNPHFSLTAQYLCGEVKYELPAGGVYVLAFDKADSWRAISQHSGRLIQFDCPD